ncbi:MAG: glycine betaine ABC transporter substrate-binding protein [Candidatus Palauibacterales bacterium]|nr:glycine betaine ABC transporter substrate-binding protein [Candidatus Palauibacterales bacterium]MDP2583901.1 glycine betaine ABC transporter substrate-binding protein [Candidatus Palauibacterales bacterium]
MRRWRSATAAAALFATLTASGCGGGPGPIVVGGKNFTEQDILGEIVATWIERTTDLAVRRKLHLGGTFVCHKGLLSGDLDLYVEYTGTALTAILGRPPVHDPDSAYQAVQSAYESRWKLKWEKPLGFDDTFVILVRRSMADSLGLHAISDLVRHEDRLVPGFGYEFTQREDGLPGLSKAYGLHFAHTPKAMELGLIYRALADGQIDVTAGNATDGQIDELDLVRLRDDRGYFPPYEAVPVVRKEVLRRHPGLEAALRRLGGKISTADMRRMNRAVDVDGRDYRQVAHDWVEEHLTP